MSDQWLSIVEYARTFNVSDMTIRRRIKTGKLQAVLRDGKYYIPMRKEPKGFTEAPVEVKVQTSEPKPIVAKAHPAPVAKHYGPSQHSHRPIERSTSPVMENQMVSVLGACEKALEKLTQNEQRIEDQYLAKIGQLESQLKLKDLQIANLHQQVEDLNLLIKILDK